jgi:3-hydroxyisobutyrate dehydrogenase-like beta-hydroxyacid dehydrogenase
MIQRISLIGFGEAAQAFAGADGWRGDARAYDKLTDDAAARAAKQADYVRAGVEGCPSSAEAIAGTGLILSLVTADQALSAARDAASHIPAGAIFCDLNSVAPATKQTAADEVERTGAHYVDVAVMSPVHPARLSVPLLLSGPAADDAADRLGRLGFDNIRVVGSRVGQASGIKMIRSVIVKGIEALAAEAMLAAEAAGVTDEVLASLDASEKAKPWAERADYCLDRMIVHGLRRAEEMEEAAKTLDALHVEPVMTRGTVRRQREIGSLRLGASADGLKAKISQIGNGKADAA